jgi:hypothetical protein
LLPTFFGLAKAGLLVLPFNWKTALQLYEKTVNRGTASPLLQNRFNRLHFCLSSLSVVLLWQAFLSYVGLQALLQFFLGFAS